MRFFFFFTTYCQQPHLSEAGKHERCRYSHFYRAQRSRSRNAMFWIPGARLAWRLWGIPFCVVYSDAPVLFRSSIRCVVSLVSYWPLYHNNYQITLRNEVLPTAQRDIIKLMAIYAHWQNYIWHRKNKNKTVNKEK